MRTFPGALTGFPWRVRRVLLAVLLVLLSAPVAAQETRTHIDGIVVDSTGASVPGATVEAVNERGEKFSTVAGEGGFFRFPAMPPATYVVTARSAGLAPGVVHDVRATLSEAPRIRVTLHVSAIAETVTVTTSGPIVDLRSSAAAKSVTRQKIELLPRGRDFTDVVAFTPGATNDPTTAGGISIDGSTGLENRFVIDGVDTTGQQIGDASVPMRAEFMEEIQVKTAGYAAEFGGSTGGVINAITRSGSNQFQGGVLVDYESNSLNGDRPILHVSGSQAVLRNDLRQDDRERWDPGFYLGGPILRDRLWFFGSYQPGLTDTSRTVTFQNGFTDTYKQESEVHYATGNLTAVLGSKLSIKAGLSISPYETKGALPRRLGNDTITARSAYATGTKGERETYSTSADYMATSGVVLAARAGYYKTNYKSLGVPFYDVIHQFSTGGSDPRTAFPSLPASTPPRGFSSDVLIGDATARDKYERTSWAVDGTWFLNAGGSHAIKAGFQTEKIANDVVQRYNADRLIYYWDRSYTTTSAETIRGRYGYFRLLKEITTGRAQTDNVAIFLQDAWAVSPHLTLNLGVRAERERIPNFGAIGPDPAIDFGFGEKLAPRLGFAWDPAKNASWKVYGSYGTYYDVTKYELPRSAFGGHKWVDWFFKLDDPDYTVNGAPTCRTGNNTIYDKPACPGGALIEAIDRHHNWADASESRIDPDLEPMQLLEYQLGIERQLASNVRVGARYVHKEIVRAIEDVGIFVPGTGDVYYIANPGFGLTQSIAARPFPRAVRDYDALELSFERRFTRRLLLDVSYTYSKLYGNYTGLASAEELNARGGSARLAPNTTLQFDSLKLSYDKRGEITYGRLASDRPHQLKAQLVCHLPREVIVGLNQYAGSGTPLTEMAWVASGIKFFPNGRGNLGRTPTLTQTDLSLTRTIEVAGRQLQVLVNVLNLFDEDTPIRYWTSRVNGLIPVTDDDFFSGNYDYETLIRKVPPDPAYGLPDVFQEARQVRLGVRLIF